MEILFAAGFAPIAADPATSRQFYVDHLKLLLEVLDGDYVATEALDGATPLGV